MVTLSWRRVAASSIQGVQVSQGLFVSEGKIELQIDHRWIEAVLYWSVVMKKFTDQSTFQTLAIVTSIGQ